MTMPDALDRFLLVTLVLLGARVLPAAEPSSVDSAPAAADQLKALNDQTIIQSSIWLDTEWDQFEHGAAEATWTLGGLWGWRVSDRRDGAVRLKVPFVYDRSDEASGHADTGGLGDIEVATGTAFRQSKTWRTGGSIELHTDTASNPALGDSVWRLHSSWSIAHDVTDWLTITPTAEYSYSILRVLSPMTTLAPLRPKRVPPRRLVSLQRPVLFAVHRRHARQRGSQHRPQPSWFSVRERRGHVNRGPIGLKSHIALKA